MDGALPLNLDIDLFLDYLAGRATTHQLPARETQERIIFNRNYLCESARVLLSNERAILDAYREGSNEGDRAKLCSELDEVIIRREQKRRDLFGEVESADYTQRWIDNNIRSRYNEVEERCANLSTLIEQRDLKQESPLKKLGVMEARLYDFVGRHYQDKEEAPDEAFYLFNIFLEKNQGNVDRAVYSSIQKRVAQTREEMLSWNAMFQDSDLRRDTNTTFRELYEIFDIEINALRKRKVQINRREQSEDFRKGAIIVGVIVATIFGAYYLSSLFN